METVDKFYKTLSKEDFDNIPNSVQKLFYSMAIKCNCDHTPCKKILKYYNHLLLQGGIFGRKELVAEVGISAAQKIPDVLKAQLKSRYISNLLHKTDMAPESIYFYDDSINITKEVQKLGVNSINVKDIHLQFAHLLLLIKEKLSGKPMSFVLIDFDKTFSISRFKKKYFRYSTKDITERHFGGIHRVNLLFQGLKKLESIGVKVGFVTFHTKHVLSIMLRRFGWIE